MLAEFRKKTIWLFFPILIALPFFALRFSLYFGENGGYPTKSTDILNHYYVTESIVHGKLFPDWSKAETSEHAVSNKLPVYHGLILAHSLSALLVGLGVPLPGSVILVSDLACVSSLVLLMLILGAETSLSSWLVRAVSLGLASYIYLAQLSGAYFSQTVGVSFGLLFFYLICKKKAPRFCLIFLFISAFAYPDTILIFAPLLIDRLWRQKFRIEFVLVGLLWLACLWIFIQRFSLHGPLTIDFSASYALVLMLVGYRFFFGEEKLISPQREVFFSYVVILIFLTTYSFLILHSSNYYLNKYMAWSYFIFPIVLMQMKDWKKRFVMLFLFCILFVSGVGVEGENKITLLAETQKNKIEFISNEAWRELNFLIGQPSLPEIKNIAVWFTEEDEKHLNLSTLAVLAISRGYDLTSSLTYSNLVSSGEPMPVELSRVHEHVKQNGDDGYSGLIHRIQRLHDFPNEILIFSKKWLTTEVKRTPNIHLVEAANLVAVWMQPL